MDYLDSIIKAFLGALGGGIFALIMFFIKIELRKIKITLLNIKELYLIRVMKIH